MSDIQDFQFDQEGNRIWQTPTVHLTFDDGEVICRYDNSCIREFGDPQFNHLEWTDERGRKLGLRVIAEALTEMKDMGFPHHFEPNIVQDDPSSYEWFVGMVMKDVQIDELHVPDGWQ